MKDMSEGQDWQGYKESVMEAALRAQAESRSGNGTFERDVLASEMNVSSEDHAQKRHFALAVGELLDEGRLLIEEKSASRLSIAS